MSEAISHDDAGPIRPMRAPLTAAKRSASSAASCEAIRDGVSWIIRTGIEHELSHAAVSSEAASEFCKPSARSVTRRGLP